MTDVEAIKEGLSWEFVLSLCEMEVVPVPAGGAKIRSFTTNDSTPSLHIYPDGHWYDYSCGKGGDQISFVMQYLGISFKRAIRVLERGVGDPLLYGQRRNEAPEERKVTDFTEQLAQAGWWVGDPNCPTDDKIKVSEYAKARWGVTLRTLAQWDARVSRRGDLLLPHRHGDMIPGVRVRYTDPNAKVKAKSFPGSTFHHGWYKRREPLEGSTLVLVEGEPDALAMWEALHASNRHQPAQKWDVMAVPSGIGSMRPEWFHPLLGRQRTYVCFDDDDAGRQGMDRALDWCPTLIPVELPDSAWVKDVADALLEGWRLDFDLAKWVPDMRERGFKGSPWKGEDPDDYFT